MGDVGEARRDAQGALFATTTDHDRRAAWLDGARIVERLLGTVVVTVEGGLVLGEHALDYGQRLGQPIHPLAHGRKVVAIAHVLLLVPRRADAEHRPAGGDDVERRGQLGQQRRVAICHAGHLGTKPHARRLARERVEHGPALEHGRVGRPHALDLVQVIHHRHLAKTGLLRRFGLLDDALEELLRWRVGEGVAGHVESEPWLHGPDPTRRGDGAR